MYEMSIGNDPNYGCINFMKNEYTLDSYQLYFVYLLWIVSAPIVIWVFLTHYWELKIFLRNKFCNTLLLHNFILIIAVWYGVYFSSIIFLISSKFRKFLILYALAISTFLAIVIIEIFITLLKIYFKRLFGFDQEIHHFEWYFVGLKNEQRALLYHMLNCWRKTIYLIPIYGMWISLYFFKSKANVAYVFTLVIISLIEVAWLIYICKVYPYESLSHNRIILVNQIFVVFICLIGIIITVKINNIWSFKFIRFSIKFNGISIP